MNNIKKVAICGLGCVGSQVVNQLQSVDGFKVCGIFSRTYKKDYSSYNWYINYKDLIDKSDIVVETIGGIGIAKDIVFYALEQGKKVVTANKYLIASFGEELLPKYKNQFFFEASVCGALPIVSVINNYFKNDEITKIEGILNGTSNYILTQVENGMSFEDALTKSQQLGFAESDPTFDIEGIDASHKAAILHYLAFGHWLNLNDIEVEQPRFAKSGQKNIASITNGKVVIKNSFDDRFCSVNLNKNGVILDCKKTGNTFISGLGAGGTETAFAVLSNIVN